MSTTKDVEDVKDEVSRFLQTNFPQIQMHGGNAQIQHLDLEEKEVLIQLGGACSGCGISPMTIQALKSRLPQEIPEIDTVYADTGDNSGGMTPSFAGETTDDEEATDAPF